MSAQPIDDLATLSSRRMRFDEYERALTTNDVAILDALFWQSPHTLRYGATENLQGYDAIRAFRAARPGKGLMRTVVDRSVTTFWRGLRRRQYHVLGAQASRASDGNRRRGCRFGGQWRVVAAHVSWMRPCMMQNDLLQSGPAWLVRRRWLRLAARRRLGRFAPRGKLVGERLASKRRVRCRRASHG